MLAVHVSNRFLDLPPVVEAGARAVGARAVKVIGPEDAANVVYQSTWMLLDRPSAPADAARDAAAPVNAPPPGTVPQTEEKIVRTWTDDYSNLLEILK